MRPHSNPTDRVPRHWEDLLQMWKGPASYSKGMESTQADTLSEGAWVSMCNLTSLDSHVHGTLDHHVYHENAVQATAFHQADSGDEPRGLTTNSSAIG